MHTNIVNDIINILIIIFRFDRVSNRPNPAAYTVCGHFANITRIAYGMEK